MYSYLDTHAPPLGIVQVFIHAYSPAICPHALPRLGEHIAHQLTTIHQRGAQRLGTCPALRTAAVEVYAVDKGGGEGRCAGHFDGVVGAELEDCGRLRAVCRDGEV